MNKKTKVLLTEYNSDSKYFDQIYEVYDINYAPYILKNFYDEEDINDTPFRTNLSAWFRGRGIPAWRDRLDLLLTD